MGASREVRRQVVHILVGGMALLLRWLTWWQAALVAIAAVLFNLFRPPADRDRRVSSGRSRRAAQIRHRDLPIRRAGARPRLPRPARHRRGGVGRAGGRRRLRDAGRRARAHAGALLESREVGGRTDRVHRLRRAGAPSASRCGWTPTATRCRAGGSSRRRRWRRSSRGSSRPRRSGSTTTSRCRPRRRSCCGA